MWDRRTNEDALPLAVLTRLTVIRLGLLPFFHSTQHHFDTDGLIYQSRQNKRPPLPPDNAVDPRLESGQNPPMHEENMLNPHRKLGFEPQLVRLQCTNPEKEK